MQLNRNNLHFVVFYFFTCFLYCASTCSYSQIMVRNAGLITYYLGVYEIRLYSDLNCMTEISPRPTLLSAELGDYVRMSKTSTGSMSAAGAAETCANCREDSQIFDNSDANFAQLSRDSSIFVNLPNTSGAILKFDGAVTFACVEWVTDKDEWLRIQTSGSLGTNRYLGPTHFGIDIYGRNSDWEAWSLISSDVRQPYNQNTVSCNTGQARNLARSCVSGPCPVQASAGSLNPGYANDGIEATPNKVTVINNNAAERAWLRIDLQESFKVQSISFEQSVGDAGRLKMTLAAFYVSEKYTLSEVLLEQAEDIFCWGALGMDLAEIFTDWNTANDDSFHANTDSFSGKFEKYADSHAKNSALTSVNSFMGNTVHYKCRHGPKTGRYVWLIGNEVNQNFHFREIHVYPIEPHLCAAETHIVASTYTQYRLKAATGATVNLASLSFQGAGGAALTIAAISPATLGGATSYSSETTVGSDTVYTFRSDETSAQTTHQMTLTSAHSRVRVFVVGGGGSGGTAQGAGGGGGGVLLTNEISLQIGTYIIKVGLGGVSAAVPSTGYAQNAGNAGSASEFGISGGNNMIVPGGGQGGSAQGSSDVSRADGGDGGSGGSGCYDHGEAGQKGDPTVDLITSSQYTYSAENGIAYSSSVYGQCGGGGGAGAAPTDKNGGDGQSSDINGQLLFWGGGGGGTHWGNSAGNGGRGGGGGGGGPSTASTVGSGDSGNALANGGDGTRLGGSGADAGVGGDGGAGTGGGGGASCYEASSPGGKGGSGIVIVRFYA